MNGTEAVVLLFFMGVFAVTAKIAHGVKTGDIVMVKPTPSAIAEGLGIKTKEKPTWEEMTEHHGYLKTLMGLIFLWRQGGIPMVKETMQGVPEWVFDWLMDNSTLKDRFLVEELQELIDYMESGATQYHREGW